VCGAARRKTDLDRLDPIGRALRQALLVDLLAVDPVRVPMQHARSVAQGPHDSVANSDVVLREIQLRLATGREIDTVGVADAHDMCPDLDLHAWRRHAFTLAGLPSWCED